MVWGLGAGYPERLRLWAPGMGPYPWDPYILSIYLTCTLKAP